MAGFIDYSTAWLFWFDGYNERLMLWFGADPKSEDAVVKLKALTQSDTSLFSPAEVGRTVGGWPTIWSREWSAPQLSAIHK